MWGVPASNLKGKRRKMGTGTLEEGEAVELAGAMAAIEQQTKSVLRMILPLEN